MCDKTSRPSTWYEDMRRDILRTCDEKYDGSMVNFVADLQNTIHCLETRLDGYKRENQQLHKDVATSCECCVFINVNSSEEPCNTCMKQDYCHFRWRGVPDQEGSDQA